MKEHVQKAKQHMDDGINNVLLAYNTMANRINNPEDLELFSSSIDLLQKVSKHPIGNSLNIISSHTCPEGPPGPHITADQSADFDGDTVTLIMPPTRDDRFESWSPTHPVSADPNRFFDGAMNKLGVYRSKPKLPKLGGIVMKTEQIVSMWYSRKIKALQASETKAIQEVLDTDTNCKKITEHYQKMCKAVKEVCSGDVPPTVLSTDLILLKMFDINIRDITTKETAILIENIYEAKRAGYNVISESRDELFAFLSATDNYENQMDILLKWGIITENFELSKTEVDINDYM